MVYGNTEGPDTITLNRPLVSTYFSALENDSIAWIVEPEYRFLEPTLMAWLARRAPGVI